jgi:biopolymer transport protein ExbD
MAKRTTREDPPRMQPPMTPMIDCIFQLLLFFLLTPSFSANEGYLTTNLPQSEGPNAGVQKHLERIKIGLEAEEPNSENVSITLNDTQSLGDNFEGLLSALQAFRAQGIAADHPVLIAPNMDVRHKWVVAAFDMAVAARFTNIQFAVPH